MPALKISEWDATRSTLTAIAEHPTASQQLRAALDTLRSMPAAFQDQPSLHTAKERVAHAAMRFAELEGLVLESHEHLQANPIRISVNRAAMERGENLAPRIDWSGSFLDGRGRQARLLVSEVVHHLRTSLEYIAYQTVWLDRGTPFQRTEFPMVHKSKDWDRKVQTALPGISSAHATMFKQLQPFKHCRWIMQLQELSNVDKHQVVVDVSRGADIAFRLEDGRPDPADPSTWIVDVTGVKADFYLADNRPMLPGLHELMTPLAGLLNTLSPDFGQTDRLTVKPWAPKNVAAS